MTLKHKFKIYSALNSYIHTYMYTFMHTFIHSYIHTYIPCGNKLLLDSNKAEALKAYFTSVFLPKSKLFNIIDLSIANYPQSEAVFFSVSVVTKALLNSKYTLSSGPENISSVF